jgi:nucleoside-diphosphate-sugar epimerase
MRIFLTGGTGYIGSAVLDAFVRAGHQVDVLVRNSEKAEQVKARGGTPVLGDAADPSTYRDVAAAADGVVLTAFEYSPRGVKIDADTIDAVLATPAKPGKFLIYTSGVWVLGPAPPYTMPGRMTLVRQPALAASRTRASCAGRHFTCSTGLSGADSSTEAGAGPSTQTPDV